MRKVISKIIAAASLGLALTLTFGCSSDDGGGDIPSSSSSSDEVSGSSTISPNAIESSRKAEPVAASGDPTAPKIVGSWKDFDTNYYLIYIGYVRDVFITELMQEHYNGETPVKVGLKVTTTETVSRSLNQTISQSIGFSLSSTVKYGIDVGTSIKGKIPGLGEAGASVSQKFEASMTSGITASLSMQTSATDIVTFTQSSENTREWFIGNNGEAAGHYRSALYSIADVYILISTSSDNQKLLSEEVISCTRPETLRRYFEYSLDGNFSNVPEIGSKIQLAADYYKTLPKPTEGRVLTKIDTTFATVGKNFSYTFNKGYPATIEVYTLGAGGGGQGGSRRHVLLDDKTHKGGGGGGGGAAYKKIETSTPLEFDITVGEGGHGGSYRYDGALGDWESGLEGGDGGATKVSWSGGEVTSGGGIGGGWNRPSKDTDLSGGTGGAGNNGGDGSAGTDGTYNSSNGGVGGKAGEIKIGTINPWGGNSLGGKGGNGGHREDGEKGGNGLVRIIITCPMIVEL